MKKGKQLYEGKAKIIYATEDPGHIIQYFKDDATAFNAAKKGTIAEKGVMNNKISTKVFEFLASQGIPTHFEKNLSDREMLVKKGMSLASPVLEFCYKRDDLGDPLINESHIRALEMAGDQDMEAIKKYTL